MSDGGPIREDTPLMRGLQRTGFHRTSVDSSNSACSRSIGVLQRAKARLSSKSKRGNAFSGIEDVVAELEDSNKQSTRFFWVAIFFILNHIVGGAVTLHFLEGWSFYDCIYFCIVTTTTVGYGDITPTYAMSKLYVVYYVVVSIALISAMLAYLVGLLIDEQEELLLSAVVRDKDENDQQSEQNSAPTADADVEAGSVTGDRTRQILEATKGLDLADYYGLSFATVILVIVLAIGFTIFYTLEKLTALDSLYVTVISATTVGFGDFEPTHNITKTFMTVWLCFSTIAVAKLVADFTDASVKAKQRAVSRRLLTASMNMESLALLDRDHDGKVDKTEFVTEMLIRSGKVDRKEVDVILTRFDQLDSDSNGQIEVSEVAETS